MENSLNMSRSLEKPNGETAAAPASLENDTREREADDPNVGKNISLQVNPSVEVDNARENMSIAAHKKVVSREETTKTLNKVVPVRNSSSLPDRNKSLPFEGTADDKSMPSERTDYDRSLPSEGTANDRSLPSEGTPADRCMPTEGTADDRRMPPEGTATDRNLPSEGTADDRCMPTEGTANTRSMPTGGTADDRSMPTEGTAGKRSMPTEGTAGKRRMPTEGTAGKTSMPTGGTADNRSMPTGGTTGKRSMPTEGTAGKRSMPTRGSADDSSISHNIQATKKKVISAYCWSFFIRHFLFEFILSFKWKNDEIFKDIWRYRHINRACELIVNAVPFANIHGILNIQADNYFRNLRCLFKEGVRLASFGFQLERHVTGLPIMELAREGFYCDENENIKCFFCGCLYNPGQLQSVRNHHSNCPLYTRRLNGNIPITQYGQNIPGLFDACYISPSGQRQGPVHLGVNQPLLDLVHVGYNQTPRCNVSQDREPVNGDRNGQRSSPSIPSSRPDFCLQSHESMLVTQCSQDGPPTTITTSRQFEENLDFAHQDHQGMANMRERQASFHMAHHIFHQHPFDMAQSGLFYTGQSDTVQCFSCGECLSQWEPSDVPIEQHARLFPHCRYVLHLKGQEYIDQQFALGLQETEAVARSTETTGDVERRGTGDCCRCFHCGEGLERWDAQDDPWIEHARLFPQCLYVRQMKGDEFVECFQQATDPQDESQTVTENQVGAMATVVENQACAIGNYSTAAMVKENADLLKQTLCKVCKSRDLSVVFLPCGHFVTWDECAVQVDKCPLCRTKKNRK